VTLARFLIHQRTNIAADKRDAQAMATYARMRLTVRGRHAILSGLAGFQREVTAAA
jgi:hypothetical protein